jgi:hypothetical protein
MAAVGGVTRWGVQVDRLIEVVVVSHSVGLGGSGVAESREWFGRGRSSRAALFARVLAEGWGGVDYGARVCGEDAGLQRSGRSVRARYYTDGTAALSNNVRLWAGSTSLSWLQQRLRVARSCWLPP